MERIQSAISKAREARRALQEDAPDPVPLAGPAAARAEPGAPDAPAPSAPLPPAAATDPAQVAASLSATPPATSADAAWAGLMEFRPDARHLERARVVSLTGGPGAGPFDAMRTRLLYLMRDKGWRRIAVTSPGPGCGKTTVTLNLALSLARLSDVRTVAIDTDLRRPALGRTLGISAGHQIADVLAGKADPARHLLRIGANLALGSNRQAVPNSAELLQSPEAAAALERIEATFQPDVMLFDLPPMLVSDDALAMLGLIDGVLIVAAAESTTAAEVDRCEQDLAAHTNVVGVVLNKCNYLEKSEGYGYGYGYY